MILFHETILIVRCNLRSWCWCWVSWWKCETRRFAFKLRPKCTNSTDWRLLFRNESWNVLLKKFLVSTGFMWRHWIMLLLEFFRPNSFVDFDALVEEMIKTWGEWSSTAMLTQTIFSRCKLCWTFLYSNTIETKIRRAWKSSAGMLQTRVEEKVILDEMAASSS